MMGAIPVMGLLLALIGLVLVRLSQGVRQGRGLGAGRTVVLDDVYLVSERLRLSGRPDRIVRVGTTLIPEEWKSGRQVSHGHRLQLGVYFLLIEEQYRQRPPFGVVVLGDGARVQVGNTDELRAEVLAVAQQIRSARRALRSPIHVSALASKCRVCGQRENCRQAADRYRTRTRL